MRTNASADGQPTSAASLPGQQTGPVQHRMVCGQAMRDAMISALVAGSVLSAPLLSVVGCIGLAQPQSTPLHEVSTLLVTSALVLVIGAISVAHLIGGGRRVSDRPQVHSRL